MYLNGIQLPTIMTYDGLMYWDDKFSKGFVNRGMNAARIIRDCYRAKEYKLLIPSLFRLFKDPNKTLLRRIEKSTHELKKILDFQDANYIYVTRIDSDDMFHKEAVAEIQRIMPFEGALVYNKGYVYDLKSGKMATWEPKNNPPFYTIIFLGSKFFNPLEHLRLYKDFQSHEDVPRVFTPSKPLPDFRYCVLVHSQHISTSFSHAFKGEEVDSKLINDFI